MTNNPNKKLINLQSFYQSVKPSLFNNRLSQKQVDGMNAIINEWNKSPNLNDTRWLSYMLATVYHETDKTMQPIKEYGLGKNKSYGLRRKMARDKFGNRIPYTDTNEIFYGRGFCQLTWYENYKKASIKLGVDFMHNADAVMELNNATKILFVGMVEGWFTSKKLSDYFTSTKTDWINSRKIINGLDKSKTIAEYAKLFYKAVILS